MRMQASRTTGKLYLLLIVILCAGAAHGMDSKAVALRKYQVLKTRVIGNDTSVDWTEFRVAAVVAGVNNGFDWHPVRDRVLRDLDVGRLSAALSGAQTVIDHNMADPEGHLLAMTVYQQMGKDDDAQRERSYVDAIVKSIMTSGDGLTAKNAWFTVSGSEEDFIVDIVLDAQAKSQSLVRKDGHDYDQLTVVGEDGAEHVLWFNTDTDQQIASAEIRRVEQQLPVQTLPTFAVSAAH